MAASRKELIALGAVIAGGVIGYVYTKKGKDDEDGVEVKRMETEEDHSYPVSKMKTIYGPVVVDDGKEAKDSDETDDGKANQPVTDGNEAKDKNETENVKTNQPGVDAGNEIKDGKETEDEENKVKDDKEEAENKKSNEQVVVDGNEGKDDNETEDDKTKLIQEKSKESKDYDLKAVISKGEVVD